MFMHDIRVENRAKLIVKTFIFIAGLLNHLDHFEDSYRVGVIFEMPI